MGRSKLGFRAASRQRTAQNSLSDAPSGSAPEQLASGQSKVDPTPLSGEQTNALGVLVYAHRFLH